MIFFKTIHIQMLTATNGIRFPQRWEYLQNHRIERINGAGLDQILKFQRRQHLSNWMNAIVSNTPILIKKLMHVYYHIHQVPTNAIEIFRTIRFLTNPTFTCRSVRTFSRIFEIDGLSKRK